MYFKERISQVVGVQSRSNGLEAMLRVSWQVFQDENNTPHQKNHMTIKERSHMMLLSHSNSYPVAFVPLQHST